MNKNSFPCPARVDQLATAKVQAQETASGHGRAALAQLSLSGGGPINILIVDDEPKNLTVLETVLDDPDYRLVRAGNADEALMALLKEEFALLILDIRMPGVTGFELAKMIKERKKTSFVPIIFLTAYYNEDQQMLAGYGTGAVDYLHKPVNPIVLRSKVAVFAKLHRKEREAGEANRVLLAEITERRRAQEQLRELNDKLEQRVTERTKALAESQVRLRQAAEAARMTYMEMDYAGGHLWTADNFAAVMGFAPPKMEAGTQVNFEFLLGRVTPNDRERMETAFQHILGGERFGKFDCRVLGDDQIMRCIESAWMSDLGLDGEPMRVFVTNLDITERTRVLEDNKLLMAEVNHRAKNLLAVVQAVAYLSAYSGDPATYRERLAERIGALGASQDLLIKNQWRGVQVSELVETQLAHLKDLIGTRLLLDGPPARLTPAAAQGIGMALHELATNASKYGAISTSKGRVRISWRVTDAAPPTFTMHWLEEGGPHVTPPVKKGFGHTVFGPMAESTVDGAVKIDYRESGVAWTLTAPVAHMLQEDEYIV